MTIASLLARFGHPPPTKETPMPDLHPAVRQVLADRLTALQREVAVAQDEARRVHIQAQQARNRWEGLMTEKHAIQEQLAGTEEVAAASVPAERATVYPEGETPPRAERAPFMPTEPTGEAPYDDVAVQAVPDAG